MENHILVRPLEPETRGASAPSPNPDAARNVSNVQPTKNKRSKRDRYNAQACSTCRRRKVKCQGTPVCRVCQASGEVCIPSDGKRKRRATVAASNVAVNKISRNVPRALSVAASDSGSDGDSDAIVERVQAITARLSHLEQDWAQDVTDPLETVPENDTFRTPASAHRRASEVNMSFHQDNTIRDSDGGQQVRHAPVISLSNPKSPQSQMNVFESGTTIFPSTATPSHHPTLPRPIVADGIASWNEFQIANNYDLNVPAEDSIMITSPTGLVGSVNHEQMSSQRAADHVEDLQGSMNSATFSHACSTQDVGRATNRESFSIDSHVQPDSMTWTSSVASVSWSTTDPLVQKLIAEAKRDLLVDNGAHIRASLDVFFRLINPYHPVFNENQVRRDFESLVCRRGEHQDSPTDIQFLSAIYFIEAETRLMGLEYKLTDESRPGQREFDVASSILEHTLSQGPRTVLSIVCLTLKARYLMYLGQSDLAYDTTSRLIRICFQLKLHDQSSFKNLDGFESSMRSRIFWSVLQLDCSVALACQLPSQIRSSDYNVVAPLCLDDRALVPGAAVPMQTPTASFIPYLIGVVQASLLQRKVWDEIFGLRAEMANSSAADDSTTLESWDAQIAKTFESLPSHLQWNRGADSSAKMHYYTPYIQRQSLVLYLRSNALRLLVRHKLLLGPQPDESTTMQCLCICEDSVGAIKSQISQALNYTDRYLNTMFLTTFITSLGCIVAQGDDRTSTSSIVNRAMSSLNDGIALLELIAPGYELTRQMLTQLNDVAFAVRQKTRTIEGLPIQPIPTTTNPGQMGAGMHNSRNTQAVNNGPVANLYDAPQNTLNIPREGVETSCPSPNSLAWDNVLSYLSKEQNYLSFSIGTPLG
ncbi:hypothetical protein KCU98_g5842, partial [Aureobasidium melanogenum]